MADQPIRVLFRFHLGVPFRQASDEEKAQAREQFTRILAKWKSSGVEFVGGFSAFGEGVGGYAHYFILQVDEPAQVREMNGDIFGKLGSIYQRHSFDIGFLPSVEEMWESL